MDFGLFPRQLEILYSPKAEILAAGDGGGKSHTMRFGAAMYCMSYPGITVALVHPRTDELGAAHVEGRTGLKAVLASSGDNVRFQPGGIKFSNGSELVWIGADREADVRRLTEARVAMAFMDDVHRLPRDLYEQIALRIKLGGGRILASSKALSGAGWVADRFGIYDSSREVIPTASTDLPTELQEQEPEPTLAQFMDSLGVGILAADSDFRRARYVQLVISVLQRWFWGEFPLLIVLMPTQSGKTFLSVRATGGYIVRRRPYETTGISSYDQPTATKRAADARNYYLRSGGQLLAGSNTRSYWSTPYGGGCWSAGFGGGSGNPMSWGLADDPDKNMKDSRSAARITEKDDWYRYVWMGREAKQAAKRLSLLMTATRFWSGDTTIRTLRYHADRGDKVHILVLPALYDPDVARYYEALAPGLFSVEPDFRTEFREPLDPTKYDRAYWEQNEKADKKVFKARDQQMPEDHAGGVVFASGWAVDIHEDPIFRDGQELKEREVYIRPTRAWDLAATAGGGGSYTAGVKMGQTKEAERLVIRHAVRARYGPRDVHRLIAAMMLLDGPKVDIVIPDDPAAGGKQQTMVIGKYLKTVATKLATPCPTCARHGGRNSTCPECKGDGWLRFPRPKIRAVDVKGMLMTFENFAQQAEPISKTLEGHLEVVQDLWTPTVSERVPWFWLAVERQDAEWAAELKAIEKIARDVLKENGKWWLDYLDELNKFPDAKPNDWIACTSYGWQYLTRPQSAYPTAEQTQEREDD